MKKPLKTGLAKIIPFRREQGNGVPESNPPLFRQPQEEFIETKRSFLERLSTFLKDSPAAEWWVGKHPGWVTPNRVTGARMLLILPIALAIFREDYGFCIILTLLAAYLDWLDGAIARWRPLTAKPSGEWLDPLSDKIVVGSSLAIPLALGRFQDPVFILLVFVSLGMAVALTVIRRGRMTNDKRGLHGKDVAANPWGKLKLNAEMAALLFIFSGLKWHAPALMKLGAAALALSIGFAVLSLLGHMRSPDNTKPPENYDPDHDDEAA